MMGITFNNKHSFTDFNLILNAKKITTPSKKKVKSEVPGMNSLYDFSTVASNGEIVYNQRAIEVQFTLLCSSKAQLQAQLNNIIAWLKDTPQSQLIFDDILGYYFMAEIEESIEVVEDNSVAEFTVKFIAEPFKTGIHLEGSDIWDTFNFETDVAQDVEFDVVTTLAVNIINTGRFISPLINVTSPMTIILRTVTYNLATGDNNLYGLKLLNGDNNMVINGTGHINFIFRVVKL